MLRSFKHKLLFFTALILMVGGNALSANASTTWNELKIGAGGWLTGIDIASNGTTVVRTDTYGAYIWNGTQWQQLVTTSSMPPSFSQPGIGQGVYEIRIAPSQPNIFYMTFDGYIFQSVNSGTNWTQTNFTQLTTINPNDAYHMNGQKMAVDPNNSNIVYAGTPQNGLFMTSNGGNTWTNVSGVPVALSDGHGGYPGITGIAFDPAVGGVVGGVTQTIFAASYGNGVYESTNGGSTWTLLPGGPTAVQEAAVSPATGVYYATDGTYLWSYSNGQWKQVVTNGTNGLHAVAINPNNPQQIVTISPYGWLNISYNGGSTWTGINWHTSQLVANDIPWLAYTYTTLCTGGLAFNPVSNELYVSAGNGVWEMIPPASAHNFNVSTYLPWTSQSIGIEQLVTNQVLSPPGGNPVVASWDDPFFYVNNPNVFPSTYGPVPGYKTLPGWSLDYASSNPSFIAGIADGPNYGGQEESGYSVNGGQTWTDFASIPPDVGTYSNGTFTQLNVGGSIAASTPANMIWAPDGGVQPYYTINGGSTWNPITLPGISSWSGFGWKDYSIVRTVSADRVLPNTFYLFYAANGVYETTNGGVTWTKQYSGDITSNDRYNESIQSVPGQAGNLFFTGGVQGTLSAAPANESFMRSVNGGATWTAVPNVLEVTAFGFGAPAPGQTYPAIYIVGWVNNVYGVWQSIDNAQTWNNLGAFPLNSIDIIKTISGDSNIYGQVYVGFEGSGYAYGTVSS